MTRIRSVTAITALVSLVCAGTALAAQVTGGTSTITPTPAAAALLATNHITVTPIAPATASGGMFTFPITGGNVNKHNFHGVIRNGGGFTLSNGTQHVQVRRLVTVWDRHGVSVFAVVRRHVQRNCHHTGPHHVLHCTTVLLTTAARVARVTGVSVSGGSATGTVKITRFTAGVINHLAGSHIVSAGATLGTAKVTPTL